MGQLVPLTSSVVTWGVHCLESGGSSAASLSRHSTLCMNDWQLYVHLAQHATIVNMTMGDKAQGRVGNLSSPI